jgi:uncharacterized membrane protein
MTSPATTPGALPSRAARRSNVGATERGLSTVTGAGLLVAGLSRRDLPGLAAGLAGALLIARGVSGRSTVYDALGVDTATRRSAPGPVEIARSITIGADPKDILAAIRDPQGWLAGGPIASLEVDGDTWRVSVRALGYSIDGIEVAASAVAEDTLRFVVRHGDGPAHEGRVMVSAAPGGRGTEVRASLCFQPRGAVGARVVRGLEGAAERAAGHALSRLRQLLETGEIARADEQPHGRRARFVRALRKAASSREAAA